MNILGIGFALAAGVFFGIIGPITKTAYNLGAGIGWQFSFDISLHF